MTTPAETQPGAVLRCVACGHVPAGDGPERVAGLVAHLKEHAGLGEEMAVTARVGRHRRQAGEPS